MSIFDSMMRDGGVPALMNSLGEAEAVEIEGKKYAAIVGPLRQEEVEVSLGTREETSHRDVCQAHIACPPDALAVKTKVHVAKYGGVFHVRSTDKANGVTVTVQLWRESLAKVQARGTER